MIEKQGIHTSVNFNMASITRIGKKAGISHVGLLHEKLSEVIATQLHELLHISLILRDERGAHILSERDVEAAIRRHGHEPFLVEEKNENPI